MVFLADKDVDGRFEIYVSNNGGTEIIKLSNVTVNGGNVIDFAISPDGESVAYLADQDTDNTFAFYTVDINRILPENKISPDLTSNNFLDFSFAWAPDSSRVAYLADPDTPNKFELYTNKIDGSDNIKVSADFDDGADVREFSWAPLLIPGNRQIAYRADQDNLGIVELYTTFADEDGNIGSLVVSDFPSGNVRTVEDFKWSPNGLLLAYRANQNTLNTIELYTTAPDIERVTVRVSGNNTQNGRTVTGFDWSPNGSFIAFRINKDAVNNAIFDVFTTLPNAAGPGTKVSGPFNEAPGVTAFAWASNSVNIAYIANQNSADELFVASAAVVESGVLISDSISPASGSGVSAFSWAPDASLIAFVSDIDIPTVDELYSTLPVFSATDNDIKLTADLALGQKVELPFAWSPDTARVAYLANQDDILKVELYSATPDGKNIDKLSAALVTDGGVESFKWDTFGQGVAYLADQDTDGVFELYASLPDGSDNQKISGTLVSGGDVIDYAWVP